MSYFQDEYISRKIPELLTFADGRKVNSKEKWEERRKEIVEIIASEMFGHFPEALAFKIEDVAASDDFLGQKINYKKMLFRFENQYGKAEVPVYQFFPKGKTNIPVFANIAFAPEAPWRSTPVEQIIDRGYGLVLVYHQDITTDNGDFENNLAKLFPRNKYDCSKITIWAWMMSRVMDYIQTVDIVDKERIAVIGHSRLGKTALWTGANDTRFTYVISNNSGASGDAISRGKKGEDVKAICKTFPFWFVPHYADYSDAEDSLPFDQHFLLAASCPRKVAVGAAILDEWADPISEHLTCAFASPAWKLFGKDGFIGADRKPVVGDVWQDGDISFTLRDFGHLLGIHDWARYMDFMDKSANSKQNL